MRKIASFCAIVMALGIFTAASFAQPGVRGREAIDDWNCSDAALPDYCTKVLEKGDYAWTFAESLYGDPQKWERFAEDNPTARVIKTSKGIKLMWEAGTKVRILKSDFYALGGKPSPSPTPNQSADDSDATLEWIGGLIADYWGLILVVGIIVALVVIALVALYRQYEKAEKRRERILQENPQDPVHSGETMRFDPDATLFHSPVNDDELIETISRLRESSGLNDTNYRRRIIKVTLTVPEGTSVLTEFRDGPRPTRPLGNDVFLSVSYGEDGSVTDVVGAFDFCLNGLLLNRMSREELATFARTATWTNPRVHLDLSTAPPYAWEPILAFLQGMGAPAAGSNGHQPGMTLTTEGIFFSGEIDLGGTRFVTNGTPARIIDGRSIELNGQIISVRPTRAAIKAEKRKSRAQRKAAHGKRK